MSTHGSPDHPEHCSAQVTDDPTGLPWHRHLMTLGMEDQNDDHDQDGDHDEDDDDQASIAPHDPSRFTATAAEPAQPARTTSPLGYLPAREPNLKLIGALFSRTRVTHPSAAAELLETRVAGEPAAPRPYSH